MKGWGREGGRGGEGEGYDLSHGAPDTGLAGWYGEPTLVQQIGEGVGEGGGGEGKGG